MRSFFHLKDAFLPDAATYEALSAEASDFTFTNNFIFAREMHRLRTTDFNEVFGDNTSMVVRVNGAVWYAHCVDACLAALQSTLPVIRAILTSLNSVRRNHLVLGTHLWQAADEYNLHRLSKRQTFEVVMNILFSSPTPTLRKPVEQALSELPGRRLGVQMRLGSPKMHDLPRYETTNDAVLACFVAETVRQCNRNCSVFLTTDSEEAQDQFLAIMKTHGIPTAVIPGEISHLENQPGASHLKTYADWYALTQVDQLVGSRSGFSETAAWFNNIPARALMRAETCLFSDSVEVPEGAEVWEYKY